MFVNDATAIATSKWVLRDIYVFNFASIQSWNNKIPVLDVTILYFFESTGRAMPYIIIIGEHSEHRSQLSEISKWYRGTPNYTPKSRISGILRESDGQYVGFPVVLTNCWYILMHLYK